eukprot:gene32788-5173_t
MRVDASTRAAAASLCSHPWLRHLQQGAGASRRRRSPPSSTSLDLLTHAAATALQLVDGLSLWELRDQLHAIALDLAERRTPPGTRVEQLRTSRDRARGGTRGMNPDPRAAGADINQLTAEEQRQRAELGANATDMELMMEEAMRPRDIS